MFVEKEEPALIDFYKEPIIYNGKAKMVPIGHYGRKKVIGVGLQPFVIPDEVKLRYKNEKEKQES